MALIKESAHSYYSGDNLGSYQFISLDHVINNFMIGYVGENKIISFKFTDIIDEITANDLQLSTILSNQNLTFQI